MSHSPPPAWAVVACAPLGRAPPKPPPVNAPPEPQPIGVTPPLNARNAPPPINAPPHPQPSNPLKLNAPIPPIPPIPPRAPHPLDLRPRPRVAPAERRAARGDSARGPAHRARRAESGLLCALSEVGPAEAGFELLCVSVGAASGEVFEEEVSICAFLPPFLFVLLFCCDSVLILFPSPALIHQRAQERKSSRGSAPQERTRHPGRRRLRLRGHFSRRRHGRLRSPPSLRCRPGIPDATVARPCAHERERAWSWTWTWTPTRLLLCAPWASIPAHHRARIGARGALGRRRGRV